MREITLGIDSKRSFVIDDIANEIEGLFPDYIYATHIEDERHFWSVAAVDNNNDNAKESSLVNAVRAALTRAILTSVKKEYYNSNLQVSHHLSSLIKQCLLVFDVESEERLCSKKIPKDFNFLNVDGLIDFQLAELKIRWGEVIRMTEANAIYFVTDEVVYELCRFVLSTCKNKCSLLELSADDSCYIVKIRDCQYKCALDNFDEVLSIIIKQCPHRVSINKPINSELETMIREIFYCGESVHNEVIFAKEQK